MVSNFDGTGNPWYKADISIQNGKMIEIRSRISVGADIYEGLLNFMALRMSKLVNK